MIVFVAILLFSNDGLLIVLEFINLFFNSLESIVVVIQCRRTCVQSLYLLCDLLFVVFVIQR